MQVLYSRQRLPQLSQSEAEVLLSLLGGRFASRDEQQHDDEEHKDYSLHGLTSYRVKQGCPCGVVAIIA